MLARDISHKDMELRQLREALRREVSARNRSQLRWEQWLREHDERAAGRLRLLALAFVIACPASFVAGGLMLRRMLELWWTYFS